MNYIMQLTDYFREVHRDITAFRFVIYSPDWRIHVRKHCWIKATDLPGRLKWLGQKKIELARNHQLHPAELTIGLANSVLVFDGQSGKNFRRYIPMIDFDACQARDEGAPESITMALEMLDMGPGVIVRSTAMNFGFAGFHFFGLDLWDRKRWNQFVADGIFDEYGFSEDSSIPMYPTMPYFAAKVIGESWCRLVAKQRGTAFLRIAENNYLNSQPEVVELFSGDVKLLVEPPDYAPCISPFREAEAKWWNSIEKYERHVLEGYPQGTRFNTSPKLQDFCVADCPINGCSLECPATLVRLERKAQRVESNSEAKQLKRISE